MTSAPCTVHQLAVTRHQACIVARSLHGNLDRLCRLQKPITAARRSCRPRSSKCSTSSMRTTVRGNIALSIKVSKFSALVGSRGTWRVPSIPTPPLRNRAQREHAEHVPGQARLHQQCSSPLKKRKAGRLFSLTLSNTEAINPQTPQCAIRAIASTRCHRQHQRCWPAPHRNRQRQVCAARTVKAAAPLGTAPSPVAPSRPRVTATHAPSGSPQHLRAGQCAALRAMNPPPMRSCHRQKRRGWPAQTQALKCGVLDTAPKNHR
jgi:hypothetical protein